LWDAFFRKGRIVIRNLSVRVLCGLMLFLGIAIGSFVTQSWGQASAPKPKPSTPTKEKGTDKSSKTDSELKNEVFRQLDESLKNAKLDDLGEEDRKTFRGEIDKIRKDLLKRDEMYSRIKADNAKALQRANTRPPVAGYNLPKGPQSEAARKNDGAPKNDTSPKTEAPAKK